MHFKNLLVATLAATATATYNGRHAVVDRRDTSAQGAEQAKVDSAATAILTPNDVIRVLSEVTDIADSLIDTASDIVNLRVANIVPDVLEVAQGLSKAAQAVLNVFPIVGNSNGCTSQGVIGGIIGTFFGNKPKTDDCTNNNLPTQPFAQTQQQEICRLYHKLTLTVSKLFDLFIGKSGVLAKIPLIGSLIIPALKSFENTIERVGTQIFNLIPVCASQAKIDLQTLQTKLSSAEDAYAFTYSYTWSQIPTATPNATPAA